MKTRTLALACVAAAVLGGCSTTDGYVDTVNEIQADVLEASSALGSDPNASKSEILALLEAAESEASSAVAELDEIDVPADAKAGHAELVASFEELSELLGSVRDQVEDSSGGEAFAELRSKGAEIDRQIDAAIDQINADLGLE